MESALTLFGYLILTFLAIIVPLFGILLSIFREGISELSSQYENEKSSSEKNIREQLKKQADAEQPSVPEIEKSIKELKGIKKTAEKKLSYLNPKKQIFRLFILFLLSFLWVISAILINHNFYFKGASIALSLIFFCSALSVSWKLLDIVIEVKRTIDDNKKDVESKIIETLLKISQQTATVQVQTEPFLKDVYLRIEGKTVKDDKVEISLLHNIKNEVKIEVANSEKRMAKKVEAGLELPRDFIIERGGNFSIYTYEDGRQIVRYSSEQIQGDTSKLYRDLIITPINEADYPVRTWIKGENIEVAYQNVLFKVGSAELPL